MSSETELMTQEDARVVQALRFAGFQVNSVYDLVNSPEHYADAVPVLVRLLPGIRHDRIKEGVARALTTRDAKPFVRELIAEFRKMRPESISGEHAKWAIGNAISIAAGDGDYDDVIALMRDKRHGWTRSMLPVALTRMKKRRQEVIGELIASLSDDQIASFSADSLARLKAKEAVPYLERLTSHTNIDVRNAAGKALKRLYKVR